MKKSMIGWALVGAVSVSSGLVACSDDTTASTTQEDAGDSGGASSGGKSSRGGKSGGGASSRGGTSSGGKANAGGASGAQSSGGASGSTGTGGAAGASANGGAGGNGGGGGSGTGGANTGGADAGVGGKDGSVEAGSGGADGSIDSGTGGTTATGGATGTGGSGTGGGATDGGQCLVAANYGALGSVTAPDAINNSSSIVWEHPLESGIPADTLSLELYDDYGVFTGDVVHTGTFTLTGDEAQYSTCGVCLLIHEGQSNLDAGIDVHGFYMATGGTVTLTSVSGTLKGTIANATFEHVTIENFQSTPVGDGCTSKITSLSFNVPLPP